MSDNEGSVPTEGIDYGDTMVVWPSTGRIPGGDVKPGGSSGLAPSMPPGWGDYSPQGIALVQSVLFPGIIRRIILDKELEEGDWSGWSVSVHSPWGNEKVSAARTVLENGLRGGLPEPSRPAAVPFARLEPASGNEKKIIRLMVTQQLEKVTDIPASQLPAAGNNVPVKYRLTDLMQNGTQYIAIIGGIPMTVPVVDAVPVPDRSRPGTNIKDVYSAPVSPNLPDLVLSVGQMNTPVLSNPEIQEEGVIAETGNYVEAGYTMSSNNHDVIVRFPDGSGVSPLYISTVEILDRNSLSQRQEAENKAKDDFRVKKEQYNDEKAVLTKTSEVIINVGDKAGEYLGDKYRTLSREIAENIRNFQGKTIRSYDEAMSSINKLIENPNLKINATDKEAIVNAWKAFDAKDMGNKFASLGKTFKAADYAIKANNIREKSIEGYQTGNWGPLMLEIESWVLSGIASTVALGLFSTIAGSALLAVGTPPVVVGIMGVFVAAVVGVLIDDKFADVLNNEIIKPAH
ncbi:colicin-like bacteriocin tRNase domain-containing protein [Escherichia coli]|uniref:colicin-like bacteriocin tRNase domain-containing protein n=1 Tax=Escherichia coli TaxID=562 RepID=UPI00050A84AA|nr:colicin-like bacteriocin tRNase domain-containing protein [Escherichia coli]